MPNRIGSVSHNDYTWADHPVEDVDARRQLTERLDQREYGVCRDPRTVIGAAYCGNETAVSNACRRSKPGTLDDLLCDDIALRKVQKWLVDLAQKAIELVVRAKMGRSK